MASANLLFKFLAKYQGLLSLEPKVQVKENYSLSLVYTPGVGRCCLDIQKDISKLDTLTNRANSILVITDGSGFTSSSGQNYHLLPYIETLCVFYKLALNIDAFPILLDPVLTKDTEDLYQTLNNLSPAYAGIELYGFSQERIQSLEAKVQAKGALSTYIMTSKHTSFLKTRLENVLGIRGVESDLVIGCFHRAMLDFKISQPVANICVQMYFESLCRIGTELKACSLFDFARVCVELAAASIHHEQPGKSQKNLIAPLDVRNKLEAYYREGQEGWVDYSKHNYLDRSNDLDSNAIEMHRAHKGATNTGSKVKIHDLSVFSLLMKKKELDGVSNLLLKEQQLVYDLTCKSNYCAIITNGTAVLGYGDIGTEAGLPVMEGKSCLFKELGGVNIVPICIKEKDPKKVIQIIRSFGHSFSGINLEDIKAPECFDIERELIEALDLPVFHDDQHGTAIVTVAALINSLKIVGKKVEEIKVVMNGAGAAGMSITELLFNLGVKNLVMCDTKGAIYKGRKSNMNKYKNRIAEISNPNLEKGDLSEVIKGADVFIGVSTAGALKPEMVKTMNDKSIVYALANPVPEIMPDEAKAAGAYIVATGRSDFPNQVNNSLAFPGIFKGALSIRSRKITMGMKEAAAKGIANLVSESELNRNHIIPSALDRRVPDLVAKFVAEVGIKEGVARLPKSNEMLDKFKENPKL